MRSVKTVMMVVVGVALVLTLASAAQASLLGYWNFNEYSIGQTVPYGGAFWTCPATDGTWWLTVLLVA